MVIILKIERGILLIDETDTVTIPAIYLQFTGIISVTTPVLHLRERSTIKKAT